MPASSPCAGARSPRPAPAPTATSGAPASAIIIAGRPLSQVAIPTTPTRCGNERISRRITMAASLRYGSESNIAVVPCDRPSHGSETKPANGRKPRPVSSSATVAAMVPSS